ncbi:MAG: TIGR01212 family radical SAM protein [Thermoguttaceae bacterium]|nr:TIGR01212 family radical SAM protein [Thermoguttaceae bacterium]
MNRLDWRKDGLRYHMLGWHWRHQFGGRTWKISLDAGCSCPHAQHGGCIFCNPLSFSTLRREEEDVLHSPILTAIRTAAPLNLLLPELSVERVTSEVSRQLAVGIAALEARCERRGCEPIRRVVAYFQPGTNTYGDPERLRSIFTAAVCDPRVVGLSIGTRPDCLSDAVVSMLAALAQQTSLCVELGVQSLSDRSLRWLERGHDAQCSLDAISRLAQQGIVVGVHLICGIPGESHAETLDTIRQLNALPVYAVKLHNLHAVRETRLAQMVERQMAELITLEAFASLAADQIEHLRPEIVIDRIGGESPPELLVAPTWSRAASAARNAVQAELQRRRTYQGIRLRDG